jgi:hypothetical protein
LEPITLARPSVVSFAMNRIIPTALRAILFAVILFCGSANRAALQEPQAPIAKLPPEVRMRKLHLVRPDLLQYPIAYEVYC